jgi:hypothetical protein
MQSENVKTTFFMLHHLKAQNTRTVILGYKELSYNFWSTFYAQRSQEHKKTLMTWLYFCAFGIFAHISCSWNVCEIYLWGWFHQHFTCNFYANRSQNCKKTDSLTVFLWFCDLCTWKLIMKRWWNQLL